MHVHQDPHRRVDTRYFFDSQTGQEKTAPWAAVLFRDLDAHDAKLEQAREQGRIVLCFLVHTRHQRGNDGLSIVAYGGTKERFFVAQDSQRPDRLGAWRAHRRPLCKQVFAWLQ